MLIKWREGEQSRRFAGVFGAGIVRVALSTCWRASWSSGIRLHQRNQTFPLSFPDEPRARPADPTPAEESRDSSPMPECCTTSLCPSIPVLLACRPRSSDPEPENRQMQISLRQLHMDSSKIKVLQWFLALKNLTTLTALLMYLNGRFHEEPLTFMESFHFTKDSL